jgi:glycine hydroxymethyltransferase
MHVIAGKALAFGEALKPNFKKYCKQIISNSKVLAEELMNKDYNVISGGTDTHLILIDLTNKNISGKIAEERLELAGITTNKNMIPFDTKSPMITSGIRIGTPALTTRGMKENEMLEISYMIDKVLSNIDNDTIINSVKNDVIRLCSKFELYPNLI